MTNSKISIQNLCDINPESLSKNSQIESIKYVDISSVGTGALNSEPKVLTLKEAPSRAKRLVKDGDTILATVRPNLRSFLYINNPPENLVVSTGFAVLRAKENIDSRFLYYSVTNQDFTNYLSANAKGTSYPAVDSDIINRGEVVEFNYLDQIKIGEILNSHDRLIANNQRRIQLLEQAARMIYKEWFVNFRFPGHEHVKMVDGIPEGWQKVPISSQIDVMSGGTPSTSNQGYWGGEIPFFTPKDTGSHLFVTNTERYITEDGLNHCNSKLYPPSTIFITARGTVGAIRLAQIPMAMNQSCYAIKPNGNEYTNTFALFALMEGVRELRAQSGGAVFNAVIVDTFNRIKAPLPKQDLINDFTDIVEPILNQINLLTRELAAAQKARDILLPRLMNGTIQV